MTNKFLKKLFIPAIVLLVGVIFFQISTLETKAITTHHDNTPPLVAQQPFILYGAGGKKAGDKVLDRGE